MIKNYRYDLICADLEYHVDKHPQVQMKELGFNVIRSEPVPIADCWWFRVDNEIPIPPKYLRELPDTFRFSDEMTVVHYNYSAERG